MEISCKDGHTSIEFSSLKELKAHRRKQHAQQLKNTKHVPIYNCTYGLTRDQINGGRICASFKSISGLRSHYIKNHLTLIGKITHRGGGGGGGGKEYKPN